MVVHAFYIFDRHAECIYRKKWNHPIQTSRSSVDANASAPSTSSVVNSQTEKLIFGTVLSLRNMALKFGGDDNAFLAFRTGEYKLHYYETPTRVKFVMLTDTKAALHDKQPSNLRVVLHQIWASLYVEYVVKNPLSPIEHPGGIGVSNELFDQGLETFLSKVLKP